MDSRFLPDTRTGRCFCCNWDRSLCPCRSGKVRKPDSPNKLPGTVDLMSPRNNHPTCRLGNRIYSLDDCVYLAGGVILTRIVLANIGAIRSDESGVAGAFVRIPRMVQMPRCGQTSVLVVQESNELQPSLTRSSTDDFNHKLRC